MGMLPAEIIKFIQCVSEKGIKGKSLIMIGKQDILINWKDFSGIIKQFGIEYDHNLGQKISKQKSIDAYDFFKGFGFSEVHALDYSDYEGADIIFDLNKDLPNKYKEAFDYVINGGTIEHVFDISKAMANISEMVKEDGIIMHYAPTAGWIDHGFYSISPTFFQDFYKYNGFHIMQLELEFIVTNPVLRSFFSSDLRLFESSGDTNKYVETVANNMKANKVMTLCFAQRDSSQKRIMYPLQGYYRKIYGREDGNDVMGKDIDIERIAQEIQNINSASIAIFGSGYMCNLLLSELYKKDAVDKISAIFDNDASKSGQLMRGILISYPTKTKLQKMDYIYVCNIKNEAEIVEQLRENGIDDAIIRKNSNYLIGKNK